MAQLEMMEDTKEMPLMHNEDDTQEEVVEEDQDVYLDNGLMAVDIPMGYAEEEEVHCEDDEDNMYGGMDHHLYDSIVDFKRTGNYPDLADQRVDRSAHCHWRLRCSRFTMHDDGMTLMYGGTENGNVDQLKFVIKKGEVRDVVERVHTLIGHVGTKRTQAALQKRMYWRSVRNDVMNFVSNCTFCRDKKQQGKKLAKAPIDILSSDFVLDISVEYSMPDHRTIRINLDGYDEEFVMKAAMTRMTTYTFRSTDDEHRKTYRTPPLFKRQPYLRRPRFDARSHHSSFLIPIMNRETREPTYMSMSARRIDEMERERMHAEKNKYCDDIEEEEELTPIDPTVASTSRAASAASGGDLAAAADDDAAAAADEAGPSTSRAAAPARKKPALRRAMVYDPTHPVYRRGRAERVIKDRSRLQRRNEHGTVRGAASRLSGMMTQNHRGDSSTASAASAVTREHLIYNQNAGLVGHDILTPFEDSRERAMFAPLPPVMFISSNDPEVAELQKELLKRQMKIQELQMQALEQQLGTRYEDVEEDGREMVEVCVDDYS